MRLSAHFTLDEFTASDTAQRLGIDNKLPDGLVDEARKTAEMLEGIRYFLGMDSAKTIPLIVTSGYRCPTLNTMIGSGPGSDHPKMMAIDFKAPAFGTPLEVCRALAPAVDVLKIGQLIYEFGSPNGGGWIHVSTRIPDKIINRVLTIDKRGTMAGIQG